MGRNTGQRRETRRGPVVVLARGVLCALGAMAGTAAAADAVRGAVQPPVIPTVHPVLTPGAVTARPLRARAMHCDVWVAHGQQHMLLQGNVTLHLAYRTFHARQAVVWLKREGQSGVPIYRIAIFLAGHVRVVEGARGHTVTTSHQLLVTGSALHAVQLSGTKPVAKDLSKTPLYAAARRLRRAAARRPLPIPFIPNVTIQKTEMALQQGWIARGPGNSMIFAPGQNLPRTNTMITRAPVAVPARPKLPPPLVFATGNRLDQRVVDGQRVTIMHGGFMMIRQTRDGKPPLELRAQDAVLFSPLAKGHGRPAAGGHMQRLRQVVTGVYLQGDVTVADGQQRVHARRLYYDFVHNQAIMINAALSTEDQVQHLPLFLRAKQIVQTARGHYVARKATLSTDEFYTPHYDIAASKIVLKDVTPRAVTGAPAGPRTYAFAARDITVNFDTLPVFYLPYFAATTSKNTIPLRHLSAGYSNTYGGIIRTDWDLFGTLGQRSPKGLRADYQADYFTDRGPAGGVNATWYRPNATGYLRSYIMEDSGTDILGRTRDNVPVTQSVRGRITARHRQDLGDGWSLVLQGSYSSDPNFLEQYFNSEYETDSEEQTSLYLRHASGTEAETLEGKWYLTNFMANADLEDNEFTVQKEPEFNYRRIGDSPLRIFTYYSDTKAGMVQDKFSRTTPADRGLTANFPNMPANQQFVYYFLDRGWTQDAIARADTRQELDLPIVIGDAKVVPYVIGRYTYWDARFPAGMQGEGTSRVWGAAGLRGSMQFWRVYDNVDSRFLDVHGLRHIIEPQVNVYFAGTDVQQGQLQPFQRSVEGIDDASGAQIALRQKLQTKRGAPGHRYTVDWMTLNVMGNIFWHQPAVGPFSPTNPLYAGGPYSTSDFAPSLIGQFYNSRPELSLPTDSLNANGSWRIGDYTRLLADESWNVDHSELEQADSGIEVNQSPQLSYFFGNRYIQGVYSDQWTAAFAYRLTRKYAVSATQSYDFYLKHNILSTFTVSRRFPRMFAAITLVYNADAKDTAVIFNLWPQGLRPPASANNLLLGLPY